MTTTSGPLAKALFGSQRSLPESERTLTTTAPTTEDMPAKSSCIPAHHQLDWAGVQADLLDGTLPLDQYLVVVKYLQARTQEERAELDLVSLLTFEDGLADSVLTIVGQGRTCDPREGPIRWRGFLERRIEIWREKDKTYEQALLFSISEWPDQTGVTTVWTVFSICDIKSLERVTY